MGCEVTYYDLESLEVISLHKEMLFKIKKKKNILIIK